MSKTDTLIIAGQKIAPGASRNIQLEFSENYLGESVAVPIRVIRSSKPGPKVCITGAIHGDELAGIGIIRELLYNQTPKLKRGSLICMPAVNVYGLEHNSRYLPDRRDLNRCFPGSASGSLSSRLAHALYQEVVSQCDYAIDFHSAAVRRTNYPNVRADMRNSAVSELAHAFGCELIVDGRGPEGALRRTAVDHGIPAIILEAGEVWKIEPGVVEIGVRGCLNVLKHLKMIDGEREPPLFQIVIKKTQWVRAERGGFLGFHAFPGALVHKGDLLSTNYNIFGYERNLLTSPVTGLVLGVATMPAVKPGEPVYNLAELPERTFNQINKKIASARSHNLFHRIRDDLSTNITNMERG